VCLSSPAQCLHSARRFLAHMKGGVYLKVKKEDCGSFRVQKDREGMEDV